MKNIANEERLFKFILGCVRRVDKPDLHSFTIKITGGMAYVEAQYAGAVYVETHCGTNDETVMRFCGTPIAAANRLIMLGADASTIET